MLEGANAEALRASLRSAQPKCPRDSAAAGSLTSSTSRPVLEPMQCSMVFCSTPRSALKSSKQTMTLQRVAHASKARLLLYKKECRISFWGLPIFSFCISFQDTLTRLPSALTTNLLLFP